MTHLPSGEPTDLTVEADVPGLRTASGRQFVSVYLETDAGDLELAPVAGEPFAMVALVAMLSGVAWLIEGPAAATVILLLGSFVGWSEMRRTSRPSTGTEPCERVQLWPAAALVAGLVVYFLAGARSDFANHEYGSGRPRPVFLVALVFIALMAATRSKALRRWMLPVQRVTRPAPVRAAILLGLFGAFFVLAPSNIAAKAAEAAFCRQQAVLPPIAHHQGHITVSDLEVAFANVPGMVAQPQRIQGFRFLDLLTSSRRYELGAVSIYATPADAEQAIGLGPIANAVTQVPEGESKTTRLQNVLLEVDTFASGREKCTIQGRLLRLR